MNKFRSVPAAIPPTRKTLDSFYKIASDKKAKAPTYEIMMNEYGAVKTDLDFSTRVVIGQPMAMGKLDMYNMVLMLMQVPVIDENDQQKPFISAKRAKQLMEKTLGMKLSTEDEDLANSVVALRGQLNPIGQAGQPNGGSQSVAPMQAQPQGLMSNVAGSGVGMDKRFQA